MAQELIEVPSPMKNLFTGSLVSNSYIRLDENKVSCIYCSQEYSTNTSSTILKKHLIKKHEEEIKKEVFESETKVSNETFNSLLINWIIDDLQPFSVVERRSFKNLIHGICKDIVVPCRQTITKMMREEFEKQKGQQIVKLSTLKCKISLTADIWTSDSDDPYIGIIAHFINSDWKLQTRLLSISKFEHPHTGDAIADKLIAITNEFMITNKIISITTDNASNMVSGCEKFTNYMYDTYGLKPKHFRCAAHVINLVIQKGKFKSNQTLEKVRNLVKCISNSSKMIQDLRIYQNDRPKPLEVVLDCPTRWNSTYNMLERILELKNSILILSIYNNDILSFLPTMEEWEEIVSLCRFLQPFNAATKLLTKTNTCSVGSTLIMFQALQIHLEDNKLIISNAEKMLKVLNDYISLYDLNMKISVFLDPQNRNQYFDQITDEFLYELNIVYHSYNLLLGNQSYDENDNNNNNNNNQTDMEYLTSIVNKRRRRREQTITEIDRYLLLPAPRIEIDVMQWWKNHANEFPVLSTIAIDMLSFQPTSVSCERLFSISGFTTKGSRNRLDPSTLDELLCLKNWKDEEI